MCLGCAGMCETIPPQTADSKKYKQIMQIIMIAELCVAMCKMFLYRDVMSGFFELFLILLLYMASNQLNHCNCVMYIIFCLYNIIFCCVSILTIIQNGWPIFPGTNIKDRGYTTQGNILTMFLIVFYSVACYFVFQGYKAFKSERFQQITGAGFSAQNNDAMLGQQSQQQYSYDQGYGNQQQNPFGGQSQAQSRGQNRAFQGQGIVIG
ncbi:hypothetical protein PPERSA_12777 [Pseudocohnilembus persalinus]|uniref:Transmembrane protein n=1 Tax=Pseudocohnilembus persalinus TaxID=266149 RepID=A0A0V0QTI0_PSEPJ|nr:hypothetical protein PPERSA_12777 [Pseudocohnilembus persalinus]|eukprot:KRX05599.1 hypothetical protein PPERSA_12777 [Pseudocohnilembus persalinus]